jgi:hypothetical protein
MPILGTIQHTYEAEACNVIRDYTKDTCTDRTKTFHQYYRECSIAIRIAFDKLKYGTLIIKLHENYKGQHIEAIDGMNELYISCSGAGGSDRVFETPHIDGLLCFLPFCTVVRCILAVQGKDNIATVFPTVPIAYVLQSHEFVVFDYNHDIHAIHSYPDTDLERDRIVLKLHYIIVPRYVPKQVVTLYKILHVYYNSTMRFLFLLSQSKNGKENLLSRCINGGTVAYQYTYQHIGMYPLLLIGAILWNLL